MNTGKQTKVIINGVDRYRVMDPLFECVRVVLSYRGEKYSPAYIQGISGAAFRIGGICPCAPTCSYAMEPEELIRLLGYECEHVWLEGEGIDPNDRIREILGRAKKEIRAGRPVLMWHVFTNYEWDVVCGFDDEKDELYGRGSYAGLEEYAKSEQTRPLKSAGVPFEGVPLLGAIFIGEKTGEFSARNAELAALKEAVHHAHSTKNKDKICGGEWVFLEGLLCYDRWIDDFKNDSQKLRGTGDSYCLGVYRTTHRAASNFLQELVPEYPRAAQQLESAAKHFAAEADTLDKCEDGFTS